MIIFTRDRAGRSHHRAQRPTHLFPFIFIFIVEKKITFTVIFFSIVLFIVIGMLCNALHHGEVKRKKSDGILQFWEFACLFLSFEKIFFMCCPFRGNKGGFFCHW